MDYAQRRHRLQEALRERDLAAALLLDPINICYLTGYWTILSNKSATEELLVVPADGAPWMAVPGLELTLAREQSPGIEDFRYLRAYETTVGMQRFAPQSAPARIKEAVAGVPAGASLGVDLALIRLDRARVIEEILRPYKVVDLGPVIAAMRANKDPDERRVIRECCRIASEAAAAVARQLTLGRSENEVAAESVKVIWLNGATVSHFCLGSGPRSAHPHALPGSRVLEGGDFVVVDIGILYENYWGEICRTFVVGGPSAEQARLIDLVQRSQTAAAETLRPGVPCCEVDEAARSVLRDAGFDDGIYIHTTGHGVGVMGADAPLIAAHNRVPVPLDATLTLEPGLYFPGRGGIRIEDTFYLSAAGVECWTA